MAAAEPPTAGGDGPTAQPSKPTDVAAAEPPTSRAAVPEQCGNAPMVRAPADATRAALKRGVGGNSRDRRPALEPPATPPRRANGGALDHTIR